MGNKYLKKIYQCDKRQVYVSENDYLNLKTRYLYIYFDDNKNICELEIEYFPMFEFLHYQGYLFIKNEERMPRLPTEYINVFKTNIKNLNYQFTDKKYDIILKMTGFRNCSPRINTATYFGFNYNDFNKLEDKDINKMYLDFYKNQSLKNVNQWFKFIKKQCPIDIYYKNIISDEDFKNDIVPDDVRIEYDIRHFEEGKIINKIEQLFDDLDSMIIIFNDFTDRLKELKKILEKNKEITATFDKDKCLIKYSDLLKLDLDWTIENFY